MEDERKNEEVKDKVGDDGKSMVQWMASALKAVHMAELSGKARARATNAIIRASRADTANSSEQEDSQTELLNSVCGDVVDRTFSILPDLLSKSVDAHLDRLRRNVALHNFDAMQVAEMEPQKLRQVQRGERKAKKIDQKVDDLERRIESLENQGERGRGKLWL